MGVLALCSFHCMATSSVYFNTNKLFSRQTFVFNCSSHCSSFLLPHFLCPHQGEEVSISLYPRYPLDDAICIRGDRRASARFNHNVDNQLGPKNLTRPSLENLNNLQAQFANDASPSKANLMYGVYRGDDGKPFILPSVIEVCSF